MQDVKFSAIRSLAVVVEYRYLAVEYDWGIVSFINKNKDMSNKK